jgi:hypothetical protein
MTEPNRPETGIQEKPAAAAITATPPAPTVTGTAPPEQPGDTVIPLPPLPPVEAKAPDTRWTAFEMFLFTLLAVLVFFLGSFVAQNHDVWMTLATGRLLAEGEYLFGPDPFAFGSDPDQPWVNHAWLYAFKQYLLYEMAGGSVLVVAKALLGVLLFIVLLAHRPRDYSRFATLELSALALLVVSPRLLLAGTTVSFLLFGMTFYLLYRSGALGGLADEDAPSPQALWWLPPLFALWVNLDIWFFLGPLTVLLCLLGNALGRFFAFPGRIDLTKLGLATVLSFAACLLNPFYVRAFTLPPEFAYLMGNLLPGSLTEGGAALAAVLRIDSTLPATLDLFSPLSRGYWSEPTKGFNIAGLSYFILLLISAASFVPALSQSGRAEGVQLSVGRLLVFAFPLVLSLWQARMIPFFAVAAAPVAVLNFADFARWWRTRPGVSQEPALSPNLARFAVTVIVLVGLALAWPGWLHGPLGQESRRHVAWEVHADPSHRAAAEMLATLHAEGQAKRVFNTNFALPSYIAWHAPGVRCYVDHRLTAFAKESKRYVDARLSLQNEAIATASGERLKGDPTKPPPAPEFLQIFREFDVDHLAVHQLHLIHDPHAGATAAMCWLQPWQWHPREPAGSTLLFAWSRQRGFGPPETTARLNQQAFGSVPKEERAPLAGTPPPQGEPPLWQQYLEAPPPVATLAATEPYVWLHYFNTMSARWRRGLGPTNEIAHWTAAAGLSGVAPGTVLTMHALAGNAFLLETMTAMSQSGGDNGPPGAGLVMIRSARRAIAENPYDANAQQALYFAYQVQNRLEEPWLARQRNTGRTPRTEIREIQLVTALRNYLDLRPEDWERHFELARLHYHLHLLDAGLETHAAALKSLDKFRARVTSRRDLEVLREREKRELDVYKQMEREVKRRRADYELRSARFKNDPMSKFRLAVAQPYQTVDANNKDYTDPRGMGLALEALKQLRSVPPESVNAQEKAELYFWKFRLSIQQGRLADAANELVPSALGDELFFACGLWQAAAMGDYQDMDSALGRMEQGLPIGQRAFEGIRVVTRMPELVLAPQWQPIYEQALANTAYPYIQTAGAAATLRTLRGLVALEFGETRAAGQHFEIALRLGGDYYFADRPIAERCLALIRGQQ